MCVNIMQKNQHSLKSTKYGIYLGWIALFLATTGISTPAQTNSQLAKISQSSLIVNLQLTQNFAPNSSDPKSQLNQGRNLFEAGRFAEAVKLWEAASISFERQGDPLNQAWSLTYLSLAYQNLGDWRKAESSITNSLNILQRLNKQKKETLLFWQWLLILREISNFQWDKRKLLYKDGKKRNVPM